MVRSKKKKLEGGSDEMLLIRFKTKENFEFSPLYVVTVASQANTNLQHNWLSPTVKTLVGQLQGVAIHKEEFVCAGYMPIKHTYHNIDFIVA